MKKKRLGVAAAALMALVGTLVLVMYVRGAEDRALAGEQLVTVIQASEPIPAGTSVAEIDDMVEPVDVPAKIVPEDIVTDLMQVTGRVTAVDVVAGETLVHARFVEPGGFSGRPQTVEVEEGLLEVTVAMSQEQFVGGVPVPGDRVAVIANGTRADFIPFLADPLQSATLPQSPDGTGALNGGDLTVTKIVIQQALVTNVQGNALPAATTAVSTTERVAPAEGSVLVTLALDGPDTERLLYIRDAQTLNANMHMAVHTGEERVDSQGISVENIINPKEPIG